MPKASTYTSPDVAITFSGQVRGVSDGEARAPGTDVDSFSETSRGIASARAVSPGQEFSTSTERRRRDTSGRGMCRMAASGAIAVPRLQAAAMLARQQWRFEGLDSRRPVEAISRPVTKRTCRRSPSRRMYRGSRSGRQGGARTARVRRAS